MINILMRLPSKHQIIAAAMNQVSDLNLAIACYNSGIMPSISFLNYINKIDNSCDIEKFENDIIQFKNKTKSSNIIVSISSTTIMFDYMSERLSNFLNKEKISHLEILVTENLDLYNNLFSINDLKFFEKLSYNLEKFNQTKIYKAVDKYSILEIINNFETNIFQMFLLKNNTGAGSVSSREDFNFKKNLEYIKLKYPKTFLIASGSISKKEDIQELNNIGIDAVSIGTLFAFSKESPLSINTKEKILKSTSKNIVKIKNKSQNGIMFKEIENDDYNNTQSLIKGISTGKHGHVYASNSIDEINGIESVSDIVERLIK